VPSGFQLLTLGNDTFNPAVCWLRDPAKMLQLSNALWHRRSEWWVPHPPRWLGLDPERNSDFIYWGWNEASVDAQIDDTIHFGAVAITLPIDRPSLASYEFAELAMVGVILNQFTLPPGEEDSLSDFYGPWLEEDLVNWRGDSARGPRANAILIRQLYDSDGDRYHKTFECYNFTFDPFNHPSLDSYDLEQDICSSHGETFPNCSSLGWALAWTAPQGRCYFQTVCGLRQQGGNCQFWEQKWAEDRGEQLQPSLQDPQQRARKSLAEGLRRGEAAHAGS